MTQAQRINGNILSEKKSLTSQPLVSVVTPVYNSDKYLSECIESVLAQTYDNWEYVIVNNCSTDRSLEIAQSYANIDQRIRIHDNKEHLGIIQNWNHALRQISLDSKYCKVIHSDDWLFKDCIYKMVEIAETNPKVGIVGSYRLEETDVTCDGLPYPSTVVSGRDICQSRLLGGPYIFGSPSTLLVRSDLLRARKYFYNEENLHADLEVCFDLLRYSDFGFVHEVLSFTRRHNESHTSYTRRLNTFIVGDLIALTKYGSFYLTEEEYNKVIWKYFNRYYNFLAQHMFDFKNNEFWTYHKNQLQKLGYTLNKFKLLKSFAYSVYKRIVKKMS